MKRDDFHFAEQATFKAPPLSGHTAIIGHLGYPTQAFKAPMIYNPYFARAGIDALVVPMGVRAEDFAAFVPMFARMTNVLGALVTMPHKIAVVPFLDELSTAVKVAGSCNALRKLPDGRLKGDMFDGEGFVRGALRQNQTIAGASALVVGAGGVGSAIAASLAAEGLARLRIFDRDAGVAEALAGRLHKHYPRLALECDVPDPASFAIVVNATPLGMNAGDPLPLDVSRLDPQSYVGEVVMAEEITPFLHAARAKGCRTQIGTDMLFEMIPAYLEFFGLPVATPEQLRASARLND